MKLWRSGIFLSALGFLGGLGNFAFQALAARTLTKSELGMQASAFYFVNLLGLPLLITSSTLVHYIAHYRGHNDEARLQGLLAGCQRFLLYATAGGSVLAIALVGPLGWFFHFRFGLVVAAVVCVLTGLWSGFAIALCQGMAWFKRLAIVGFMAVLLRILFGFLVMTRMPTAEAALSATTFSLLANLALFYWWKDIFKKDAARVSPWNREFLNFWIVTAACIGGNWLFTQSDSLAAARHFPDDDLGLYNAAGQFGRAIVWTVGPLLQVVFTSRSGKRDTNAKSDQQILLGLYAVGLVCAAAGLILLRDVLTKAMFAKLTPASAELIPPFAIAMVFACLSQAVATWSLASRSFKLVFLYGGLGLVYWMALLALGRDPHVLLRAMDIGAGVAFAVLAGAWFVTQKQSNGASEAAAS